MRVLDALRGVPRALFLPEDQRSRAYDDRPLGDGPDAAVPTALVVARMCEALELRRRDRVLDVGAGLGYRAAVAAGLCAEVVAVVTSSAMLERVQLSLRRAGVTNVRTLARDVAELGAR